MKKILIMALSLLMTVSANAGWVFLDQAKAGSTVTLKSGDTATGHLSKNVKVVIESGALVFFNNVVIEPDYEGGPTSYSQQHAGVYCKGDATIEIRYFGNVIHAYGNNAPGIYVPKDKTLTIRAAQEVQLSMLKVYAEQGAAIGAFAKVNPSLASGFNSCGNIVIESGRIYAQSTYGAAIGGARETSCGNITINGGSVVAKTYGCSAAIGSGYHTDGNGSKYWADCGIIRINGGVVKATNFNNLAAGIGTGSQGRCEAIFINEGVDSVYAKGYRCIGKGPETQEFRHGLMLFGQSFPQGLTAEEYIYPTPVVPEPEPEPVCEQPYGVTVTEKTHNSALVSWSCDNEPDRNIFYVMLVHNNNLQEYYVSGTYSYRLTNLEPNSSYSVYISHACGHYGINMPSDIVRFTTPSAPTPPSPEASEAYTVYEDGVLTYYYDNKRSSRTGTVEVYNPANPGMRFSEYYTEVTTAVIDPSFINASFTSFRSLFFGGSGRGYSYSLKNMTDIIGLENIDTYSATDLGQMFEGCKSLTYLDLRSFDLMAVQNVNSMFYGCSALEEVILGIDEFDLGSVTNMFAMFSGCSSLTTIYCNHDFSGHSLYPTGEVFDGCTSLVGGQGTTYSASHTSHAYARPDGGSSAPGYFTSFTCPQVENITVVNVTGTSAEIFWDATSPYQKGWIVNVRPGTVLTYTEDNRILLTDLQPNTRYTVGIQSSCGGMDDIFGKSVSFTTSHGEGIEETSSDSPSKGEKILRDGQLYIIVGDKMYDARGEEVK